MTLAATIEIDQRHKEAKFRLMPFVVALLLDRPIPHGGRLLEIGQANHLTREVIEALQDILPQAVLRWLIRSGGWQEKSIALPNDDSPTKKRIWDEPNWNELNLTFTHEAIDLLLIVFSLLAPAEKKDKQTADAQQSQQNAEQSNRIELLFVRMGSLGLTANGDLLLHHMIFRRLWTMPQFRTHRHMWFSNPLNGLAFPLIPAEPAPGLAALLKRLFEPDLTPLLPWLLSSVLKHLQSTEPLLWQLDTQPFLLACSRVSIVEKAWIQTAMQQSRPDLLVPMLRYFSAMTNRPTSTRIDDVMATTLTRHKRMSERQTIAQRWLQSIDAIDQLEKINGELTGIYPIDRDAPVQLFLAEYQKCEFDRSVAERLRLRATWIPTIG